MVSSVDLAPTIVELANAGMCLAADGRSLVPLLADPEPFTWRKRVFAEFVGTTSLGGATFSMTRTGPDDAAAPNAARIVWSGAIGTEFYDLAADPHQLQSRHDDPATAAARAHLDPLVEAFKTCKGSECRGLEQ
jgi:hypothetical protein